MDQRIWSDPLVIAAAGRFVCLRLATYESKEEAALLSWVFVGRQGTLENTVFAVLSPDGKTKLTRGGRSPDQVFGGAEDTAAALNQIAARYPERPLDPAQLGLPVLADMRLALNVAACDQLPLVAVVGADDAARRAVEQAVAQLAWSDRYRGRLLYVRATPAELGALSGERIASGVLLIEPDPFGRAGEVKARVPAPAGAEALRRAFDTTLGGHRVERRDTRSHIRAGERAGVFWETAIPVTDPHVPRR